MTKRLTTGEKATRGERRKQLARERADREARLQAREKEATAMHVRASEVLRGERMRSDFRAALGELPEGCRLAFLDGCPVLTIRNPQSIQAAVRALRPQSMTNTLALESILRDSGFLDDEY